MFTASLARTLKTPYASFLTGTRFRNHARNFAASSTVQNVALPARNLLSLLKPTESEAAILAVDRSAKIHDQRDAYFLENPGEEYGGILRKRMKKPRRSSKTPKVKRPSMDATNVLLSLVAKGDLHGAEAAKNEYDRMKIGIVRHKLFANAALSALDIVVPQDRIRQFIAWWSLVPIEEFPEVFDQAARKLLDHPFDLLSHAHFCLHGIRQGLVSLVLSSPVLRHFFRFGYSTATTAFLHKIEREVEEVRPQDPDAGMAFREIAIKMHLLAARRQHAAELYYAASNTLHIDEKIKTVIENAGQRLESKSGIQVHPHTFRRSLPVARSLSNVNLASEVRALRQMIACRRQPPHFETFLSDFLHAYSAIRRKGVAPRLLRKKAFEQPSSSVRIRWVGGEIALYSSTSKSIACLKTYLHYCLADNILAIEARRVLKESEIRGRPRRRALDAHLANTLPRIKWKLWPTSLVVNAAWKAILRLSSRDDLERMYKLLISVTEATHREAHYLAEDLHSESDGNILGIPDFYYRKFEETSTFPIVFPTSYLFHHFTIAFATCFSPRRGAEVITDMQRLGLRPNKRTWGALAGAYARAGDMKRVLRILDHIDTYESETDDTIDGPAAPQNKISPQLSKQTSLIAYNSVLRGLTECGMYPETRMIQKRMHERGLIDEKVDGRTLAILHRRSRYEKGKHSPFYKRPIRRRRRVKVDGRYLRIDEKRVDWLGEESN